MSPDDPTRDSGAEVTPSRSPLDGDLRGRGPVLAAPGAAPPSADASSPRSPLEAPDGANRGGVPSATPPPPAGDTVAPQLSAEDEGTDEVPLPGPNVIQLRAFGAAAGSARQAPQEPVAPGAGAVTEDEGDGELRPPPPELLVPAVEACLFAATGVVTVAQLAGALRLSPELVSSALDALRERLVRTGSGLRVVPVADGWQLRTEARLAVWVAAIRGGKPVRLSRPALETLAIVAFRQPVTKGAVDDIRGVDSGGVLRMLLDRGLVKMLGRSEDPGRPLTYGTTPAFLELFGMRSLADLPTLKDLRQLQPDDPPPFGE